MTEHQLQERDACRLQIYDMIQECKSVIREIDVHVASIKLNANERKGPLHRCVNNLERLLVELQTGESTPELLMQTLGFTPELQKIIDKRTEGL